MSEEKKQQLDDLISLESEIKTVLSERNLGSEDDESEESDASISSINDGLKKLEITNKPYETLSDEEIESVMGSISSKIAKLEKGLGIEYKTLNSNDPNKQNSSSQDSSILNPEEDSKIGLEITEEHQETFSDLTDEFTNESSSIQNSLRSEASFVNSKRKPVSRSNSVSSKIVSQMSTDDQQSIVLTLSKLKKIVNLGSGPRSVVSDDNSDLESNASVDFYSDDNSSIDGSQVSAEISALKGRGRSDSVSSSLSDDDFKDFIENNGNGQTQTDGENKNTQTDGENPITPLSLKNNQSSLTPPQTIEEDEEKAKGKEEKWPKRVPYKFLLDKGYMDEKTDENSRVNYSYISQFKGSSNEGLVKDKDGKPVKDAETKPILLHKSGLALVHYEAAVVDGERTKSAKQKFKEDLSNAFTHHKYTNPIINFVKITDAENKHDHALVFTSPDRGVTVKYISENSFNQIVKDSAKNFDELVKAQKILKAFGGKTLEDAFPALKSLSINQDENTKENRRLERNLDNAKHALDDYPESPERKQNNWLYWQKSEDALKMFEKHILAERDITLNLMKDLKALDLLNDGISFEYLSEIFSKTNKAICEDKANLINKELREEGSKICKSAIEGICKVGKADEALEIFKKYIIRGVSECDFTKDGTLVNNFQTHGLLSKNVLAEDLLEIFNKINAAIKKDEKTCLNHDDTKLTPIGLKKCKEAISEIFPTREEAIQNLNNYVPLQSEMGANLTGFETDFKNFIDNAQKAELEPAEEDKLRNLVNYKQIDKNLRSPDLGYTDREKEIMKNKAIFNSDFDVRGRKQERFEKFMDQTAGAWVGNDPGVSVVRSMQNQNNALVVFRGKKEGVGPYDTDCAKSVYVQINSKEGEVKHYVKAEVATESKTYSVFENGKEKLVFKNAGEIILHKDTVFHIDPAGNYIPKSAFDKDFPQYEEYKKLSLNVRADIDGKRSGAVLFEGRVTESIKLLDCEKAIDENAKDKENQFKNVFDLYKEEPKKFDIVVKTKLSKDGKYYPDQEHKMYLRNLQDKTADLVEIPIGMTPWAKLKVNLGSKYPINEERFKSDKELFDFLERRGVDKDCLQNLASRERSIDGVDQESKTIVCDAIINGFNKEVHPSVLPKLDPSRSSSAKSGRNGESLKNIAKVFTGGLVH